MGCSSSKDGGAAGERERDGLTGAAGAAVTGGVTAATAAVVGGVADAARAGAEAVPAFSRQLLEHVHDATGAFADATVRTGELVAAATAKVASKADFMRKISQPEVRCLPFRLYSICAHATAACSVIALAAPPVQSLL